MKYDMPDKDTLLQLLEQGNKKAICDAYNVSYPVINRWLKFYDIKLPKYYGNIVKLDETEFRKDVESLTFGDICKKYNLGWQPIKKICKRLGTQEPKLRSDGSKKYYDIVRDRFDKLVDMNTNQRKSLIEIANEFCVPIHYVKAICKEMNYTVKLHSHNKSRGELEVIEWLSNIGITANSIKPKHNDIRYEIDCYLPDYKVGIEYCGEFWHSIKDENSDRLYHQKKFIWAKEQGIHLITIFEHEWKEKQDIVKSIILAKLGRIENKIYARKCELRKLWPNEAREFFEDNHIDGYVNSSIRYGLFYNGDLVSAIAISKYRFSSEQNVYEITRFANRKYTIVVGGIGKLLRAAINELKQSNDIKIISFANLRYGAGSVYSKLGFEYKRITPPNYFYIHKNTNMKVSRIAAQKHKLHKLLEVYDETKTEFQNMMDNKYLQIFDCGNNMYEFIV